MQIFKSKFKAPKEDQLLCVGGPLGLADHITSTIGATSTVRYLNNLISCYSSRSPKIDFFPDKHGDLYELYGDKEIPGVKEFVKTESVDECLELAEIECHICGMIEQAFAVQSELKQFLQQQEMGLDVLLSVSGVMNIRIV